MIDAQLSFSKTRISQQQLESYLWGAATLLRGTIDAGDYKQFIFPLLFYKRLCDVFDEETRSALKESGGDKIFAAYPENHRFQVPEQAHWCEIRNSTTHVGYKIKTAMRAIETANQQKLYGIFGDAQWTNKHRLSDAMLRDLVEHFSTLDLTLGNLPEDELGQGYEFLIKKFADDSGHTAAEFYTNRTVVHLMTELLQREPGDSIYDPTCGSGGMLLSAVAHLRGQRKEWRNLRLYGQERNLMTSSIARMNCFLHGIEDFQIVRGDTLSEPKFVEGDELQKFDVVLANPPYSIKQWNRTAFASDPWGRQLYGVPPQGRADYAFWQHILCSLKNKTGRCAILFPHGVLFRQEEAEMRRKIIEADLIECVIGLGPNLFYNSPMEACIVICRALKPKARKGKILFINAVNEVTRERAQSFLTEHHIEDIVDAFGAFKDESGFICVGTIEQIRANDFNLSIPLYVSPPGANGRKSMPRHEGLKCALEDWLESQRELEQALKQLLPDLKLPKLDGCLRIRDVVDLFKDTSKWTRVRFGDVVENLNETVRDPAEAGLERFIGLEHLEPCSLHIRSWGNIADGTTFTRRCHSGQVLFGKRRAYQRKVAVAEFDAVVSGDIYVLAPKDVKRLLPALLPFICLSERFFKHAVGTSAGSLSPRTNWSSLRDFELELAPIHRQRQLANILIAMDEMQVQYDLIKLHVRHVRAAIIEEHFRVSLANVKKQNLSTVASVNYGITLGGHRATLKEERPYLRVANVLRNELDLSEIKTIHCALDETTRFALLNGDVLIVEGHADIEEIGRAAVWHGGTSGMLHQNHLIRARCSNSLMPDYLNLYINSTVGRRYMRNHAKSSSGLNTINSTVVKQLLVPITRLGEQQQVVGLVHDLDSGLRSVVAAQRAIGDVFRCFVEEIL